MKNRECELGTHPQCPGFGPGTPPADLGEWAGVGVTVAQSGFRFDTNCIDRWKRAQIEWLRLAVMEARLKNASRASTDENSGYICG
jgi:hypothetical protein